AVRPEADLESLPRVLELAHAALADQARVAHGPLEPGAERRAREPRVSQHAQFGGVPAARRAQAERRIGDERDRDLEDRIDLVDRDALARRGDRGEVDTRLAGDADRVEALHLEETAVHLSHRGEAGVARRITELPRSDTT